MILIIEDGTGLSDANSYVSLDYVNRFFSDRYIDQGRIADARLDGSSLSPYDLWTGSTEEKEGAIVMGADHIEAMFGFRMLKPKKNPDQALSFPWVDRDYVPLNVMKANCLYALYAIKGDLIAAVSGTGSSSRTTTGNVIKELKETGPIVRETEYSPEGATTVTHVEVPASFPLADYFMRQFIREVSSVNSLMPANGPVAWRSYQRN